MGKVLDFHAAKLKVTTEESTNSTDARGVFYFEIAKKLIFALVHLQAKFTFNYIFNIMKIVPHAAVNLTPSNFFVKSPDIISHGIKLQLNVKNPYMQTGDDDKIKNCSSFIYEFLNQFYELMVTKDLEDLIQVYCFRLSIDNQPNRSAISITGPNNTQNMVVVFTWPDYATDNQTIEIEFKLWVPVTSNEFENLDHIYAIDMVGYVHRLIDKHVPGVTSF